MTTANTTATLTLNNSLTVTGALSISGATIAAVAGGGQTITVDPGQGSATFNWYDGSIGVDVNLAQNVTTTISAGQSDHGLNGADLNNQGTVNWTGGNIAMSGNINNEAGGTFNLQGSGTLSAMNNNVPSALYNSGTMTSSAANAPGPSINVPFNNSGSLSLQSGQINFNGGATQDNANASTQMFSGTTMQATTYNLDAGWFFGEGTFIGNFNNGDPNVNGSGGTLHPGRAMGVVTAFTIQGNYVQTSTGSLYIEFLAPGQAGTLDVTQNNGAGGLATMAGTVIFHRDQAFFPSAGQALFLVASTLAGSASWMSDPASDSWVDSTSTPHYWQGISMGSVSMSFIIG